MQKKLNEEERELWEWVTKDIQPLDEKKKNVASSQKNSLSILELRYNSQTMSSIINTPGLLTPTPKLLSPFTRKDLKNFKSEKIFDLHGMRLQEAYLALFNFLQKSQQQGCKKVLIITGKGDPSNPHTLRLEIPRWLKEPSFSSLVLSYHEALPKHGGKGAFYLILRKALIK